MDGNENNGLVTYEHASIDSIPTGFGSYTTYEDVMNFFDSVKDDFNPSKPPKESFLLAA